MDKTCPVEFALSLINGKWKMAIMKELSEKPLRYGDLGRCIPEVSSKVLISQLREMEQDGLIAREVFPEVPPRVEYALTEKGRSIATVVIELRKWGMGHDDTGMAQCKFCRKCALFAPVSAAKG